MAVKKCCVDHCESSSVREEDNGVTYHKYPKDVALCNKWISITHHKLTNTNTPAYVCSRHFRKNDFKLYKASKYILKSDAIPSIFTWKSPHNMESINVEPDLKVKEEMEKESEFSEEENSEENVHNLSNSSKDSEIENLDAIKKFIENQEKAIQELKSEVKQAKEKEIAEKSTLSIQETSIGHEAQSTIKGDEAETLINEVELEKVLNSNMVSKTMDPNVMDIIMSESEANKKNDENNAKKTLTSQKGSMALSVGSKVEAKDFGEDWHEAEILEVDFDEMEVLVHYETKDNKHDEWINVSSPRLRPIGSGPSVTSPPPLPIPEVSKPVIVEQEAPIPKVIPDAIPEQQKPEEKPKLVFEVGERCLARWKDSRRFAATITNVLGDGSFEVVFDDGFLWKCRSTRLYKLKDSARSELTVNTALPPVPSTPSPVYPSDPSDMAPTTQPVLPFHTHLFDPTRDYLGSKSERREKKRKLNIKEIFNIGQKKKAIQKSPKEKNKRVFKQKINILRKPKEEALVKKEIPDAVASIIGTIKNESCSVDAMEQPEVEVVEVKLDESNLDRDSTASEGTLDSAEQDNKMDVDSVVKEEVLLEKFELVHDANQEEVIDKMKAVINKLEDGLIKAENSPKPEIKAEVKEELVEKPVTPKLIIKKKDISKVKKSKKLRLIREKKVKKQVAKVKSELEAMKRQVEEMRKQMALKKQEGSPEMPESFLMPDEWCCKWVNGQPVGKVCEIEGETKVDAKNQPVLPRRSVQVEDKRLPVGWTKHMVRRSFGNSAGKWDVVLIGPDNRRFHTKNDMRNFFENNADESLKPYENALLDFGVHLKLARRMGWYKTTPDGEDVNQVEKIPVGLLECTSPLVKRKTLGLKKNKEKKKLKKKVLKPKRERTVVSKYFQSSPEAIPEIPQLDSSTLEEGYVYVGLLKVQIIENLLRCPAEGCFKNFRNNTLLQMHIKHYHRELRKMLGSTPQVLDLAYARTKPTESELAKLMGEGDQKVLKVKLTRPSKKTAEEPKVEPKPELTEPPATPIKLEGETPKSPDSPKLRNALTNKLSKRPRVLLPVRKPTSLPADQSLTDVLDEVTSDFQDGEPLAPLPPVPMNLDFENVISSHTVTKPWSEKSSKKGYSEDDDCGPSDVDTRSSFPRSGSPDSKVVDVKMEGTAPVSSESAEEQKERKVYMYTETGERIKIVHMKREEIINCHCGFREEDGLMVQCELCLCWQHALCHNIQHEAEVPEKYTCSICLNPRRGRRSQRFLHDQDRLYEGLLPGAAPLEALRRSHELSGNLLRLQHALHAARIKHYVATKKDHPKLYLWAKDWEPSEIALTQERLNSDYSDLNIMINNIDKENLPMKTDEIKDLGLDMQTATSEDPEGDRFAASLGSPGVSLDLPISTSELERLAKAVQEESQRVMAPQPEAPIESGACRERLLKHLARVHTIIDSRLDSIEAQVAELESQDPSFEDDETVDYLPRTKQTIRMLMRDLDTMEDLGVIT